MSQRERASEATTESVLRLVKNLPQAEQLKMLEELACDLGVAVISKDDYEDALVLADSVPAMEGMVRDWIFKYARLSVEAYKAKEESTQRLRRYQRGPSSKARRRESRLSLIGECLKKGYTIQQIATILREEHGFKITNKTLRNDISSIRQSTS